MNRFLSTLKLTSLYALANPIDSFILIYCRSLRKRSIKNAETFITEVDGSTPPSPYSSTPPPETLFNAVTERPHPQVTKPQHPLLLIHDRAQHQVVETD
ncbi:hypothetical protein J6590_021322 [Homalodisca vitripennis]|nr:hypothetical protein J6590_021322 [Homalodisca vitripennis]